MSSATPVKFLLVDDLDENLLALTALLRRDGLELFTAKSGPEALELLLVHDFSLALLDVQMDMMDGFELAEFMRSTERTRRVPIIFLSAIATDERRRFRGYEAGAVDYLFKPIEPQVLRNKADVFFELASQRLELASQRDELQATTEKLAGVLDRIQTHADNSPLGVIEFDRDFRITNWSQSAYRIFGWQAPEVLGRQLEQTGLMSPVDLADFRDRIAAGLESQQSRVVREWTCRCANDSTIETEWYSSILTDKSGQLMSIAAQIVDITERRQAEETQKLLIGELNHRVKNTLATVQAIATQTLRHMSDPKAFAANFTGRLQALARAHSLLSDATWSGANLTALIRDQLRLGAIDETRLNAHGPEVWLSPELALHLALLLHELGTNAIKYGALSTVGGSIDLDWDQEDDVLRVSWREQGGPPVTAPSRRGFGTTLLEQGAKARGGRAQVTYRAEGIEWNFEFRVPRSETARPRLRSIQAAEVSSGPRTPFQGSRLQGRKILVVEDEAMVALEITTILENVGAEIVGPFGTVEGALDVIGSTPIDVALLDGNLGGASVDEIAAALTKHGIPFCFVSGYGKDNLPQAFQNAAILNKPFTDRELIAATLRLVRPHADIVSLGDRLGSSR